MPYGNSPKVKSEWAMATAQAKKSGYDSFKSGTPGDRKRKQIAEAIDRGSKGKKRKSFGFGR